MGNIRLQFSGPLQADHCFVQSAEILQRIAQAVVVFRTGRVDRDGPANVIHGNRGLASLEGDHPQQMQRVGVCRLPREDPPIDLPGHVEPPGPVVLHRNRVSLGDLHKRSALTRPHRPQAASLNGDSIVLLRVNKRLPT